MRPQSLPHARFRGKPQAASRLHASSTRRITFRMVDATPTGDVVADAPRGVVYKACSACMQARADGGWAEAVGCSSCKGTGAVRTRESWVCNGCGGCMCPSVDNGNGSIPHGLVDAKVAGGCDSPALSDCTTYTFSLCEACLRELFNGFKVPPLLGEYMLGGGDGEAGSAKAYADEASSLLRARERERVREEDRRLLHERRLCTETQKNGDSDPWPSTFCGLPGLTLVVSDSYSWYLCQQHVRDAYMWNYATVAALTWNDRRRIARRYMDAFAKGERVEPADRHETAIFISTLFPLVAKPETCEHAASELARITRSRWGSRPGWRPGDALPTLSWASPRIATNFPPGSADAAIANRWITWGRGEGYLNATAAAFLGYSAERMWLWRED